MKSFMKIEPAGDASFTKSEWSLFCGDRFFAVILQSRLLLSKKEFSLFDIRHVPFEHRQNQVWRDAVTIAQGDLYCLIG